MLVDKKYLHIFVKLIILQKSLILFKKYGIIYIVMKGVPL